MGGGQSSQRPPPVVQQDPYPANKGIDGISEAGAYDCAGCKIIVSQGISTSTVKLTRQQGDTTAEECGRFAVDIQRVKNGEFAFQEFMNNLQAGKYLNRAQTKGSGGAEFCNRIKFDDEFAKKVNKVEDVEKSADQLKVFQIQKLATKSYSSDTKLTLIPSIPFKVTISDNYMQPRVVDVTSMSLYHPCPVRVENRQFDGVLSLNDPAIGNPEFVILLPLEGASVGGGPSADFFGKVIGYIPSILKPNPEGKYDAVDVPTGAGWELTKVMKTGLQNNENVVKSSFFKWKGTPGYVRTQLRADDSVIHYGWTPDTANPTPTYIIMKDSTSIGSLDLQTLRMLPVTPSSEAIHPIPEYFTYKPGIPEPPTASKPGNAATWNSWLNYKKKNCSKEKFTVGETKVPCDPFSPENMETVSKMDSDTIIKIVLSVIASISVFIGVYFALKYATTPVGDFFKKLGEKLARAMNGAGNQIERASRNIRPVEPAVSPADVELTPSQVAQATQQAPVIPSGVKGAIKDDTQKGETFGYVNTSFAKNRPSAPQFTPPQTPPPEPTPAQVEQIVKAEPVPEPTPAQITQAVREEPVTPVKRPIVRRSVSPRRLPIEPKKEMTQTDIDNLIKNMEADKKVDDDKKPKTAAVPSTKAASPRELLELQRKETRRLKFRDPKRLGGPLSTKTDAEMEQMANDFYRDYKEAPPGWRKEGEKLVKAKRRNIEVEPADGGRRSRRKRLHR